ncbi:MAG: hypothetical protein ACRERU_02810 [Methylococcales bacterium]
MNPPLIKQARLNQREALARFNEKAWPGPWRCPERWNWLYRNNPFQARSEKLPIWCALRDGDILGHSGAMAVPLKIGVATHAAAWGVDTFVLSEARGLSLAKQLQAANHNAHEIFMSLYMSKAIRHIKKKLGAVDGPVLGLYCHTRRLLADRLCAGIRERLRRRLGDKLGSGLYMLLNILCVWSMLAWLLGSGLRRFQSRVSEKGIFKGFVFKVVEGRFGAEMNELWCRIRERYDLAVERNSDYMNWKFTDQPHMNYQRYYVYCEGSLCGLIIFRLGHTPEPPVGVIAEMLLWDPSRENCSALIHFAQDALIRQGTCSIYCATADNYIAGILSARGYLRVSAEPLVFYSRNKSLSEGISGCRALLGLGDHDWDQFPNLRQLNLRQICSILRSGHY